MGQNKEVRGRAVADPHCHLQNNKILIRLFDISLLFACRLGSDQLVHLCGTMGLIGLSVEQVIQLIRFVEFKLDQPARTIGVLIDI